MKSARNDVTSADIQGLSRAAARRFLELQNAGPQSRDSTIFPQKKLKVLAESRDPATNYCTSTRREKRARRAKLRKSKLKPEISVLHPSVAPSSNILTAVCHSPRNNRAFLDGFMPHISGASVREILDDMIQLRCNLYELETARSLIKISTTHVHLNTSQTDANQIIRNQGLNAASLRCTIDSNKVQAIGSPRVWANSRQELCESLPYFRSYQSGVYSHNNVCLHLPLKAIAEMPACHGLSAGRFRFNKRFCG